MELDKVLKRHLQSSNSASITITGGGALSVIVALIAIIGIIYASAEVRVATGLREADAKEIASLRDEIHKMQSKLDEHDVWIKTMYSAKKQ